MTDTQTEIPSYDSLSPETNARSERDRMIEQLVRDMNEALSKDKIHQSLERVRKVLPKGVKAYVMWAGSGYILVVTIEASVLTSLPYTLLLYASYVEKIDMPGAFKAYVLKDRWATPDDPKVLRTNTDLVQKFGPSL